jgi:hypothetical protein
MSSAPAQVVTTSNNSVVGSSQLQKEFIEEAIPGRSTINFRQRVRLEQNKRNNLFYIRRICMFLVELTAFWFVFFFLCCMIFFVFLAPIFLFSEQFPFSDK